MKAHSHPAPNKPRPPDDVLRNPRLRRQLESQLRELVGYYRELGLNPARAVRSALADLPEAADALTA